MTLSTPFPHAINLEIFPFRSPDLVHTHPRGVAFDRPCGFFDASIRVDQRGQEFFQALQTAQSAPITTIPFFQRKTFCAATLLGSTAVSALTGSPLPLFGGLLTCLPSTFAQERVGKEFQVSPFSAINYQKPGLASSSQGAFVAVYEMPVNGTERIFGQLFHGNGTKNGQAFAVSPTNSTNLSLRPVVTYLSNGNIVVVWRELDREKQAGRGLFGQLFADGNTPVGSAFQVHSHNVTWQAGPSLAAFPKGNFVVTWYNYGQVQSYDVFAQLFTNMGVKVGEEFQVNSETYQGQVFPSVAVLPNSERIVIVWESGGQDNDGSRGVYGKLFTATGDPLSSEFPVHTDTKDTQDKPVVTAVEGDKFVVCWQSWIPLGTRRGLFCQLFDEYAAKLGEEFFVTADSESPQYAPSLANFGEGGENLVATILWDQKSQNESAVFGQIFEDNIIQPQTSESVIDGSGSPGSPRGVLWALLGTLGAVGLFAATVFACRHKIQAIGHRWRNWQQISP